MSDAHPAPPPGPVEPAAWNANLPPPRTVPESISQDDVVALLKSADKVAGRDYLIVDVRRTDFEDYALPTAINLPAHSLYATRAGVAAAFARIPLVVFHCQSCTKPGSRGRGAAAYYQDAVDERGGGGVTSKARYLEGGVKGWVARFAEEEPGLVMKL